MPMTANQANRRRGVAMVWILFAVSILFVLCMALAVAGNLSTQVSHNIASRTQARLIAESSMDMAVAYVLIDPNWRENRTPGTWVGDAPLFGGTFTLDASFTDSQVEPLTLTTTARINGAAWTSKAVLQPQASLKMGVFTRGKVALEGSTIDPKGKGPSAGGTIDSYDSRLGPYGGANAGGSAETVSLSTSDGTVSVTGGSRIAGDVSIGQGGDPFRAVYVDASSVVTGAAGAAVESPSMPVLTAPAGLGSNTGNLSIQGNDPETISSNLHVQDLEIKSNAPLYISGNVIIYAEGNVDIWNKPSIEVLPNSSLTLYVKGSLDMHFHSPDTMVQGSGLSRMRIISLGTDRIRIWDGSDMQGVIVAPTADVIVESGASVCGAIMAKNVTIRGGAALHEDKNITGADAADPVVLGGNYSLRWDK